MIACPAIVSCVWASYATPGWTRNDHEIPPKQQKIEIWRYTSYHSKYRRLFLVAVVVSRGPHFTPATSSKLTEDSYNEDTCAQG